MEKNTIEFIEFVKECQEKHLGISLPTIEILYSIKIQQSTIQDENTKPKKTKK